MTLMAPVLRSKVTGAPDQHDSQCPLSEPLPALYSPMPSNQPANSSRMTRTPLYCVLSSAAKASIVASPVMYRVQTGSAGFQGGLSSVLAFFHFARSFS